ncbi:MAG: hypothetical protein ACRC67_32765 [Inquilinus sp.]|uniref:hypothetical protein n=1 Tax=Inquilinus sp. TaxID=1932117 RepID=UPI003F32941B
MSSTALDPLPRDPVRGPATLLQALRRRDPTLAGFGLALLALAVVLSVAWALDPRQLHGEDVWAKPVKFLLSVGLFALTSAWFIGELPQARRNAAPIRAARWTVIAAGTFELGYITLQGALGQPSHFNESTPFHTVMFALMGIGAVALTATTLPLAREIARHGTGLSPALRLAIVLGLVLTFILGVGAGVAISTHGGHAVGGTGGPGLPLLGWSTTGGDLRVPHFLGIHAQQLLPLAAAGLTEALPMRARPAVWLVSALYVLLTLAAFAQAMAGRPLIGL